jgi:uncharacterized iron-regulated membrane protein
VLLAAVGAVLEVTKRIGWKQWRDGHSVLGLILGLSLAAVSALAAIGFEYSAIDRTMSAQTRDTEARAALTVSLSALDAEAATLTKAAAELPPEWVTSSLRYSSRLGEIAAERAKLSDRLAGAPPASGASYLVTLADALGVDYRRLVLALLVVVALALELAVYDLTPGATEARPGLRSAVRLSHNDEGLLSLATVEPGAPLLGYRSVAALVGLSIWQARQAFARLAAAGAIERRGGRYFRASCSPSIGCRR